jgi:hypothetical protein
LYLTQRGAGIPGETAIATAVFTDTFMTNTDHFRGDGLAFPKAPRRVLLPTAWSSYDVTWDVFDISNGAYLEPCSGTAELSTDTVSPFSLTGFSHVESIGRWTDGRTAAFECAVQGARPATVRVTMAAFVAEGVDEQHVRLSVDDGPPVDVMLDVTHDAATVEVPVPPGSGSLLRLELELPDAVTPKEIGLSDDSRLLGVSVSEISFAG